MVANSVANIGYDSANVQSVSPDIGKPKLEDAMKPFALAAVLCVLTASSVLAIQPVPFHAVIDSTFAIPAACGETCAFTISGVGQVTHMGRVSIDGPSMIDFATGVQTGTSTLTGADGSELEIEFHGTFSPTSPTDVAFSGTWTVISGTGRIRASDGAGSYHGTASLAANTGELHLDGSVSDTGRN